MKGIGSVLIVAGVLGLSGCAAFMVEDSTARRGQALESGKVCEDRCMERFHECKDDRVKGPGGRGASACAHEKNSCKARC